MAAQQQIAEAGVKEQSVHLETCFQGLEKMLNHGKAPNGLGEDQAGGSADAASEQALLKSVVLELRQSVQQQSD